MLIQTKPHIVELGKGHARDDFSCGEPALDKYLRERASQDQRRRVSRVFVAEGESRKQVIGFYTLSAGSVEARSFPSPLSAKLPKYPIPVALIGRLAVDRRFQRIGLGGYLLADAFERVLLASQSIAVFAVIVDAKDDRAMAFYRRFGFEGFSQMERRLFLPLATVERVT